MCGLILAPSKYGEEAINSVLDKMIARGPDGRGIVTQTGWILGHCRLAIQDTTHGQSNQPFMDPDRTWAFVGEVFNRPHDYPTERGEMQAALARQDFHELDGFWSLIELVGPDARVYTDHLGIKPLYWWPEHNIICSELTPMFLLEKAPPLDEIYLANCIKWGYDYSGRTPWVGIQQIAPGTRLVLSWFGQRASVYWDWAKVPYCEDLRTQLDEAIANRLVGDKDVALLLSGGLDSSIIHYSLKAQGRTVKAFSVENGESEFLPDDVATLRLNPTSIEEAVRMMQAPLDLGSLIPQVQLADAVFFEGFNVCLSGDGADELFGGYRRAAEYDSQASDVFCELPYYHLPRLDRVMMGSVVELRSPYLAPGVVAHALNLPRERRTAKQALKEAYASIVPEEIINRPKHPLKTQAVIEGGVAYRQSLVQEMRNAQKYL